MSKNNTKKFANDPTYKTIYSGKKILVIDDNEINIKAARNILTIYGFSVDYFMSGIDTLNMLKMKTGNLPPVIALTTEDKLEAKLKLINNGFTDVLSKPIKNEDLDVVLFQLFK